VVAAGQDRRALPRSYLSSQVGDAAYVMPQDEHAIAIDAALDPVASSTPANFGELSDL
jgi:hypothetical protein